MRELDIRMSLPEFLHRPPHLILDVERHLRLLLLIDSEGA